ncbi:hypothetical protein TSTA_000530 [Talaromyces stipitatus ATCC 10500]|uniref:BTB domain-containing protein n=1 Tax=Talaromyces stipitatus (strain ATCC 10500 / CBS 375.48 / QM 6759 / NRRL 1006) TaxID=441959 RepID=B8MSC1_TALSN|nr:uncharacterized protein TSTA_000530 [Talaromyces stipitatus ATCC 10500]EED11976.1 hypothetical protein TSTA_000530 [Talaromyces stipitatus ATCC 10500]
MGKYKAMKKTKAIEQPNGATAFEGFFQNIKYSQFPPQPPFSSTIRLHDVHEDAGHSLVHFLYTGGYQTIKSPLNKGISDVAREYRKSVFVYEASRKYGIIDLENLAHQYTQRFRDQVSLSEILLETRDIFSRHPEDETWFQTFIRGELQRFLGPSGIARSLDELSKGLGRDDRFDNIVLKIVVEILSVRLRSMFKDGETPSTEMAYKDAMHAEETVYEDEPPVEEVVHEDEPPVEEVVHKEEPPVEEVVHEEQPPVEAVQASILKASPADLAFYQDWGSLNPSQKRKKVKKLRARGLPTPNEDGSIPVFVT